MSKAVRIILRVALWGAAVVAVLIALAVYLLYAPAPPEPALSARPVPGTVRVGALDRTYLLYAPARAAPAPPLLVVFHGSMGSPADIRVATGYEFDMLADRHGFVVVYPQGFEGNWNDCRRAADYSARRLGIDDDAFFEALVARLRRERGIDPARVFVAGLSNGAQFVFRLALEHPERIAGAAVFAASLPMRENSDCTPRGAPPPMMIVNGTADPINPFEGGNVSLFGFADRGPVLSSRGSAAWFARASGAAGPATTRANGVERHSWRAPGGSEVVLLAVEEGGHVVPQPSYRAPRLLGRSVTAVNGPAEAWEFFRRQPPR